jgi:hypothetical protein
MANPNIWIPGEAISADNTVASQAFIASAGQTVFTLTEFSYARATGSLYVYVGGLFQRPGTDFTETSQTSFTLTTPADEGTIIAAVAFTEVTGGYDYAAEAAAAAAAAAASALAAAASEAAAAASASDSATYASDSASSAASAAASEAAAASYASVGLMLHLPYMTSDLLQIQFLHSQLITGASHNGQLKYNDVEEQPHSMLHSLGHLGNLL